MEANKDIFNERKSELNVLSRTPVSFIVVGKPGCGKTTLSKRLASVWKCQLVNEVTSIEDLLKENSPLARKAFDILSRGDELNEEFVADVISRKLESPEVGHYGYVLDCLPSYMEDWNTVQEQINFIKKLKQTPDIIINLKIPDVDLLKRRVGQKIDPLTNEVFTKSSYQPDTTKDGLNDDEENEEEDDEEVENEEDESVTERDEFSDDLGAVDELQQLAPDIADRLVIRKNDRSTAVQQGITYYKHNLLRHIEDYIIQHNRQYVIELDANLPPIQLFRSLLVYLSHLGVPRAAAPKRLASTEDGEEDDETAGMDTDQFLAHVSGTGVFDRGFRWKRSLWGKYCPVEIARGNIVQGQVEFAVGLLDKMYCLSSAEALSLFYKNPREFLLPPNPKVPCKICVLGPPSSGKSTLAALLAEHFNAMVVNVESLMYPVMEKMQQKSVSDAKEKVKQDVMARLLVEQDALRSQNGEDTNDVSISEDHPDIIEAMRKVEQQTKSVDSTAEVFIEAFSEGVRMAEEKRREDKNDNRSHGGWIIDGFPLTRSHWSSMIDANLLPDAVLSLENTYKDKNILLKRFCSDKGLPDPTLCNQDEKKTETGKDGNQSTPLMSPEVDSWQKRLTEFTQQWGMLSEAIKGSAIDPIVINCSSSFDQMMKIALHSIESVFEMPAVEADDDADVDDDPAIDEDDAEEDDEMSAKSRKPWGDTSFYCPVAFKNQGVLWPGNLDISARYKDRHYSFSTDEAKEKFIENPNLHVADDTPLKPPAARILLLGPRGSGKTAIGRQLAKKTGMFHISFQQYLQELILPKMKRPPLMDEDDFEGVEDSLDSDNNDNEEVSDSGNDLDEDVAIALTEKETEIRSYLIQGEQLQEEHLEELITPFWTNEPYKSTGIILEGFPSQGDELRFICSKGLFPDAVCILETEEDHVIERLMPTKMEIWKRKRDKKITTRTESRQKMLREWENDKAKRKTEIEEDYKQKKQQRDDELKDDDNSDADDEQVDPFLDEYQEQLAELMAEDPPEEEEYQDEGQDEYEERAMTSIKEKHEEQTDSLNSIKDVLGELQIPCQSVPAGRKFSIVFYCVEKAFSRLLYDRDGLFTKCTIIDKVTAKTLLDHCYKKLSKFGHWCPVKLTEEPQSVLPPLSSVNMIPVIYRERIYFLSSKKAQQLFQINPGKYLHQTVPSLPVPIRIALIGPPKSGKTTIANRFCQEYGCLRLSIGEAIRKTISDFPLSDLTEEILLHLKKGQTVPDELCILALERVLLDVQCTTRGYVLDGFPNTKAQIDLLNKYQIIPVTIVELNISDEQLLIRAEADRNSVERSYTMHDSPSILMVKSAAYQKHLKSIKEWYSTQHNNWSTIDAARNNWFVWTECQKIALKSSLQIQQYLIRVAKEQAASIYNLCVTLCEFSNRLGELENYCPVCLKDQSQLNNCLEQSHLQYAVEYKGYYYRTCNGNHLQLFLCNPDNYAGDLAHNILPPPNARPQKKSEIELKEKFPVQYELKGFCPVTYINGKQRYDSLVRGSSSYSVEYKNKLYCFSSESTMETFMRYPYKYEQFSLPVKLPPIKQPMSVSSLPMLGYMEQSVAVCIINSLTAVGCFKPKFPFLTASQSAQIYLALHLKGHNPNASTYTREKFQKKLQTFEQKCDLISYLVMAMDTEYKDPKKQTIQFKNNMTSFLALTN